MSQENILKVPLYIYKKLYFILINIKTERLIYIYKKIPKQKNIDNKKINK